MDIQKIHASRLNAAAYNPRKDLKPGDREYEKLKRSIAEFGYVEPVIWNKTTGRVVGGHQRLKVLMDMGVTAEELEKMKADAKEEMDEAVKFADESPYPDPSEVTDDMYATDNERCVAR